MKSLLVKLLVFCVFVVQTYAGTAIYRFIPDTTNGSDVRFSSQNGTTNDVSLLVGWPYVGWPAKYNLQMSAIKIDLSKVPIPASAVTKTVLYMYCYSTEGDTSAQKIRIYEPYAWNNSSSMPTKAQYFVGYLSAPTSVGFCGMNLLPASDWYSFWKGSSNTGFLFYPDSSGMSTRSFYSSDKTEYTKRPYLRIEFTMPSLARPFTGFLTSISPSQKFGEHWQNKYSKRGYRLLHNGVDVPTYSGNTVTACLDGVVKYVTNYDNENAQIVCVSSNVNSVPLVITYTHILTSLKVGDVVVKGKTKVGMVASIPAGAHLHFQCRVGNVGDSRFFTIGRLPEVTDSTLYPSSTYLLDDGFPGFFINPQELPWE